MSRPGEPLESATDPEAMNAEQARGLRDHDTRGCSLVAVPTTTPQLPLRSATAPEQSTSGRGLPLTRLPDRGSGSEPHDRPLARGSPQCACG
jgi:hypothetical protein